MDHSQQNDNVSQKEHNMFNKSELCTNAETGYFENTVKSSKINKQINNLFRKRLKDKLGDIVQLETQTIKYNFHKKLFQCDKCYQEMDQNVLQAQKEGNVQMSVECHHTICNPCLFKYYEAQVIEQHSNFGICCDDCQGSMRPAPMQVRAAIIDFFFQLFKETSEYKENPDNITCPGSEVENVLQFTKPKEHLFNECLICEKKVCFKCKDEDYKEGVSCKWPNIKPKKLTKKQKQEQIEK